jgi:hypothetical protein
VCFTGAVPALKTIVLLTVAGIVVASALLAVWQSAPDPAGTADFGMMAHSSSALDLAGEPVDPLKEDGTTVLIFVRSDCPISNRYAPELNRLATQLSDARFWLVYPDADETPAVIQQHLDAYSLTIPAVRDPDHVLVEASGATVTPEAAVFRKGVLEYRGRIDDTWVALGQARNAPTRRDLSEATRASLAGTTVAVARTTAIGCYIPRAAR